MKQFFHRGPFVAVIRASVLCICWILSQVAHAQAPPAWWSTGNPPVLKLTPPNNSGPATIGQAKWMVKGALDALQAKDPVLALTIRNQLTTPQPNPTNPSQMLPAVLSLDVPANPKPAGWVDLQKAPLLIGQLKAISAPFYTNLKTVNAAWLANQRVLNGTLVAGSDFPWTTATADDANKAIATVGQLKAVFSLRFDSFFGGPDTDGDGLPDSLEMAYFGDLQQSYWGDFDGDGLNNLAEYQLGTSPVVFDSDGDGVPDGEDPTPLSADYQPVTATAVRVLTPLK